MVKSEQEREKQCPTNFYTVRFKNMSIVHIYKNRNSVVTAGFICLNNETMGVNRFKRNIDNYADGPGVGGTRRRKTWVFSYNRSFNHDFGRITGIAASSKGNIVLCDHNNNTLILVDNIGKYLTKLNVDSEPYDVAITSQNIGYITQPNTRSVLQIDPDRMVVLSKNTWNKLNTTVICATAFWQFCNFGVNFQGQSYIHNFSSLSAIGERVYTPGQLNIGSGVVKTHTIDGQTYFSCIGGQNDITVRKQGTSYWNSVLENIPNIATIDTPTDICSDDNGHLYVSGQGSNNIHRLTQDGKVLDIPLHSQQGIIEPVAICFNKNYTKFYVVNEWENQFWSLMFINN
ncbi:unnamed protein product [Mytilus edulis]|uniref:Uncharacterized protein n=1 Tax=Mytilus edulis TaxID=6550 RepID=A0A8S3T810_MYTED|nr:unnamed protein product [Mytilus edulis]